VAASTSRTLVLPPNGQHEPMTHDHHLIHLDNLGHEKVIHLQVLCRAHLIDVGEEHFVVGLGQRDAGKQIGDDAVEEWYVMCQELGQVDVDDGAQD